MNERIKDLAGQAGFKILTDGRIISTLDHNGECGRDLQKFAKLLIEEVLDQVAERAYYTGDRDWSDEVDRQWIQLEFGYGPLEDAKKGIFK